MYKQITTLIIIVLVIIVCGCTSSQSNIDITNNTGATNTNVTQNTVVIDINTTKVTNDTFSIEKIRTNGVIVKWATYEIKGRVIKIALNSDVSVFTYSSGDVMSYQNAQAFPWKPDMRYDIIADQYSDGFHITSVDTY
jgi:hypothetical protein